jgi:alkylation response protein AidB-like acyl-CoA dehydrogenase
VPERLYREIRPARMDDGASRVQRLIIARAALAGAARRLTRRPYV